MHDLLIHSSPVSATPLTHVEVKGVNAAPVRSLLRTHELSASPGVTEVNLSV